MSGHSKWHSIKHKKGAADAKRGKIFTVHAKMIALAARGGPDPSLNAALRAAIDRAKEDNVPNANVERAIKRGSGQDKDAAAYEEITYEAFGPDGSVFMIDCITDNKNRSLTNVRIILMKNFGNLGALGTVAWKFEKKAFILVNTNSAPADMAELTLIDCGADDLSQVEENTFEIYTEPQKMSSVAKAISAAGYVVEKQELIWKAKEYMKVSDIDLAKKIFKLIEKLEEDEDVVTVHSNVDLDESVLASL